MPFGRRTGLRNPQVFQGATRASNANRGWGVEPGGKLILGTIFKQIYNRKIIVQGTL